MLKQLSLIAAVALGAAGPTSAQSFKAENRVLVTPLADGLFSVPSATDMGARGTWCAAADYAMDVLGASGTSRIYVRVPPQTNSGPVVFGMTPGNAAPVGVVGLSAGLRSVGGNLSVDHAFQFCYDARLVNRR